MGANSLLARWGLSVISMADDPSYHETPAAFLPPASNMKIYTTGVCADLLGADYRCERLSMQTRNLMPTVDSR